MSLTIQQLATDCGEERRTVRTQFRHKRLSTPREAVNRENGSDYSDHSEIGKVPQRESVGSPACGETPDAPLVYRFSLVPAGGHPDPLSERMALAIEAAHELGLRVENVVLTVDREGAFDPPTEARVRKWLKRCGRHAGLRAKWPTELNVCHAVARATGCTPAPPAASTVAGGVLPGSGASPGMGLRRPPASTAGAPVSLTEGAA